MGHEERRGAGWAEQAEGAQARDGGRPWGAKWVERAEQRAEVRRPWGSKGWAMGSGAGGKGGAGGAGGAGGHALGAFKVICSGLEA